MSYRGCVEAPKRGAEGLARRVTRSANLARRRYVMRKRFGRPMVWLAPVILVHS